MQDDNGLAKSLQRYKPFACDSAAGQAKNRAEGQPSRGGYTMPPKHRTFATIALTHLEVLPSGRCIDPDRPANAASGTLLDARYDVARIRAEVWRQALARITSAAEIARE